MNIAHTKTIILLSAGMLFSRINAGWLDDLTTFSWGRWAARHTVGIAAHTLLANYVDQSDESAAHSDGPGFAMFAPQIGEWVVGSAHVKPTFNHGAIRFIQIDQELHPAPRLSAWISIPLNILVYGLLKNTVTDPMVKKCESSDSHNSLSNCTIRYTADNLTSSASEKIVGMITRYFRPTPARNESAVAHAVGCRTCLHEAALFAPSNQSPRAATWQAQGHLTKEQVEEIAHTMHTTCPEHRKTH